MSSEKAVDDVDAGLNAILKKTQDKSWTTLLPDELQLLLASFLPSHHVAIRSKSYVVLSAFCQHIRQNSPQPKPAAAEGSDPSTEAIVNVYGPSLISKLGDTVELEVLSGLTFFAALFQTDWPSAAAILLQDGVVNILEDIPDLFTSNPSPPVFLALAHLLAQAAGHKSCRTVISPQAVSWLEGKARQKDDDTLKAAAAVALIKFNKGSSADAASNPLSAASSNPPTGNAGGGDEDLVTLMKGLVLDASAPSPSSPIQDAVEGLAYMSADPNFKELLCSDEKFLSRLFAIIPRRKNLWSESSGDMGMTPLYGTVLIITNLCAYRPRLTEEETQIAKLRRLAKASGGTDSAKASNVTEENKFDNNEHVLTRGRKLIEAGVMDALTSAVKATESRAVRLAVGRALLSLIEDNSSRGKILQSGGAKALITIIQGILTSARSAADSSKSKTIPQLETADLEPIQALAKLAITASPVQVFGPDAGTLYDAIRPFSLMLTHPSATLLQQFEATMALTNLSSTSPEASEKIARSDGLLNRVELLMLEDHTLARRAAVELVCNLIVGSDDVFEKYGGSSGESAKRKLQVLVALCDVDDLPTRRAASGAVATIAASPTACQHLLDLQKERSRVLPILGQLIDPSIVPPSDEGESGVEDVHGDEDTTQMPTEPGLVHRGVMCIRNLFFGIKEDKEGSRLLAKEAEKLGIVKALARTFREHSSDRNSPVLRPAAEALKCMMESGITIQM
ncbi:ARM repeat-containing protein [Cristinia sonorae]|uniref:ARM repeat-containing protein n=1 Tax=Cristinia sonorae TaxID=1940300 RepID=A0A8K0UTR3_9AGAR|nr:ARM repeat-containing protein [Cristinia sonorae]